MMNITIVTSKSIINIAVIMNITILKIIEVTGVITIAMINVVVIDISLWHRLLSSSAMPLMMIIY